MEREMRPFTSSRRGENTEDNPYNAFGSRVGDLSTSTSVNRISHFSPSNSSITSGNHDTCNSCRSFGQKKSMKKSKIENACKDPKLVEKGRASKARKSDKSDKQRELYEACDTCDSCLSCTSCSSCDSCNSCAECVACTSSNGSDSRSNCDTGNASTTQGNSNHSPHASSGINEVYSDYGTNDTNFTGGTNDSSCSSSNNLSTDSFFPAYKNHSAIYNTVNSANISSDNSDNCNTGDVHCTTKYNERKYPVSISGISGERTFATSCNSSTNDSNDIVGIGSSSSTTNSAAGNTQPNGSSNYFSNSDANGNKFVFVGNRISDSQSNKNTMTAVSEGETHANSMPNTTNSTWEMESSNSAGDIKRTNAINSECINNTNGFNSFNGIHITTKSGVPSVTCSPNKTSITVNPNNVLSTANNVPLFTEYEPMDCTDTDSSNSTFGIYGHNGANSAFRFCSGGIYPTTATSIATATTITTANRTSTSTTTAAATTRAATRAATAATRVATTTTTITPSSAAAAAAAAATTTTYAAATGAAVTPIAATASTAVAATASAAAAAVTVAATASAASAVATPTINKASTASSTTVAATISTTIMSSSTNLITDTSSTNSVHAASVPHISPANVENDADAEMDYNFQIATNYIVRELEGPGFSASLLFNQEIQSVVMRLLPSSLTRNAVASTMHFYGSNIFQILDAGYKIVEKALQLSVVNTSDLFRAEFQVNFFSDEAKEGFLAFGEAEDAFMRGFVTAQEPEDSRDLLVRFLMETQSSGVEQKCKDYTEVVRLIEFVIMLNCLGHKTMVFITEVKNSKIEALHSASRIIYTHMLTFVDFLASCCHVVRHKMTKLYDHE